MPDKTSRIYSATYSNVRAYAWPCILLSTNNCRCPCMSSASEAIMSCEGGLMTGSMQRTFSKSPTTTSPLEPGFSREKCKKVFMKKSRVDMENIKVCFSPLLNSRYRQLTMTPGTWVPLAEGRILAERNGIYDKLAPIFEYTPGDRSPPPAPKHATAASNRPKAPKAAAQPRRVPGMLVRPCPLDLSYADRQSNQQSSEVR